MLVFANPSLSHRAPYPELTLIMESLTPEQFRELWSRTYNTEGKPDWSHIFPYYHDEIVFEDCIQRIEGIDEFRAMCARLAKRCQQLNMTIISVAMNPSEIFFEWKMVMMFNKYPPTPVFGCSKLTFAPDNRIIHQRDYFDMWGDIFNGIPYFRGPYRKFVRRHFG
jgi:limonene-1,2-epoxide hydrolase